ncbi:isochorismate synthase DhbC [Streptomyces termitum]|uniref:isochorismate synthase n=1 Tax=Streptomyces termitum TaxID=67368 RepID=A0A918T3Q1_9ACTN|nr:isochorismate synthase DhbC [Streptomyces termitum]GHA87724.1 isochorismate synthase DhbC [Streptomyces termitum]
MSTVPRVAAHPPAPVPPPAPAPARATAPVPSAVGAATGLLDAFRAGDRLLATPTRTLLAHGVLTEVPHGTAPVAARAAAALAEARDARRHPSPVVLGAIPFDQTAPAALVVPETVRTGPALASDPLVALPADAPRARAWTVRPHPDPEEYARGVAAAVDRMWNGEFSKVVLARTLEVTGPDGLDLAAMVRRLARRDPHGHTFALPTHAGRTLLGASPELLVSRHGNRLVSNPLAGSTPRSDDLAEDVRRAAALLESAKDLHEHAVVVDAVHQAMAPYCSAIDVPTRPSLIRTAAMWHLSTTVTGTLAHPEASALEIASALHPTPAVCGTPTPLAREVIRETEPFDRGFFTGIVGWGNADGDGEWVVTIRCAEADDRTLRLYAGAGVVSASVPADETAETAAKFRTFLHAVGADL